MSLRARLVATDHKVVAVHYLWAGLVFLAIGGALAMIMRWQQAYPSEPVPLLGEVLFSGSGGAVTPAGYTSLFTNHGLIMVFFAITPILIGCFGTYLIPLLVGARDMAFPRVTRAGFWIFALSQALVLASILAPGGAASSGWSMYAPLSTSAIGDAGMGQAVMCLAILATGVATILGAINIIVTAVCSRAAGMTWRRMPLTAWAFFLTSILNVAFVPVLAVAAVLLFADRVLGTQFFTAGAWGAGDPVLYQHLFWIFGHPEVYILILPVWGIIGDLLAVFSRKPAFWYRGQVYAMAAVTSLSGLVYGHHLFRAGIGPVLGKSFEALTLAISAPAVILYVCWLCTLWRGSIRRTVPMLFALGAMVVFGLGGLSGLFLGAITIDIYLHDSMWVVGHFHLIMAASTFLGAFAAIYYWFPRMFGKTLSPLLGRIHFWGSFVFLVMTFGPMLWAGYAGHPRRLYDPYQYEVFSHLRGINAHITWSAFLLGATQVVFVVNFFVSLRRGKPAQENPWQATTLEWTSLSAARELDTAPAVFRGPHEHSHPDVIARLGRDFLAQSEEWPRKEGERAAAGKAEKLAPRETAGIIGASLALATVAMAAMATFFSYGVLRAGAQAWPPAGAPEVKVGYAVAAIALLVATAAVMMSRRALGGTASLAGAVASLGAAALGVMAWLALGDNGLLPAASPYASMVALLVGLATGLAGANAAVLANAARKRSTLSAGWSACCCLAALIAAVAWSLVTW